MVSSFERTARFPVGFELYEKGHPQGAGHISDILDRVVGKYFNNPRKYGLPAVLVADSCSTNIAAFQRSAVFQTGVLLPCCSHLLHNSINAAIEFVPDLAVEIATVRRFCVLVRGRQRFSDYVLDDFNSGRDFANRFSKAALLDCETRWNSTYHMINRFLIMAPFMSSILIRDNQGIFTTSTGRRRSTNNGSDAGRFQELKDYLLDNARMRLTSSWPRFPRNLTSFRMTVAILGRILGRYGR